MARETVNKCDGCGRARGATEPGWWVLRIGLAVHGGGFSVMSWGDAGHPEESESEMYCGEACLLKRLNELISKRG
jgi:hypothetical protein